MEDKWIRRAISLDGGANWSYGFFTDNGMYRSTRRNGISTAFDPVTGLFIASWLDDNNNITFHVAHTSQPPFGTTADIKSLDAPSITCTNQGTYNCYVAFTNTENGGPCLAIAVGRVETLPVQGFVVNSIIYGDCTRNTGQTPYIAVADWDQIGHKAVFDYKPLGYFQSDYVVSARRQYGAWNYGLYLPASPRISQPSVGYIRMLDSTTRFVSAQVGGSLP